MAGQQHAEDGEASHAMGEQQSYITGDSAAVDSGKDMVGETNDELVGTLISQSIGVDDDDDEGKEGKDKQHDSDSAYDSESSSVIRLSNGMVSRFFPPLCFIVLWSIVVGRGAMCAHISRSWCFCH